MDSSSSKADPDGSQTNLPEDIRPTIKIADDLVVSPETSLSFGDEAVRSPPRSFPTTEESLKIDEDMLVDIIQGDDNGPTQVKRPRFDSPLRTPTPMDLEQEKIDESILIAPSQKEIDSITQGIPTNESGDVSSTGITKTLIFSEDSYTVDDSSDEAQANTETNLETAKTDNVEPSPKEVNKSETKDIEKTICTIVVSDEESSGEQKSAKLENDDAKSDLENKEGSLKEAPDVDEGVLSQDKEIIEKDNKGNEDSNNSDESKGEKESNESNIESIEICDSKGTDDTKKIETDECRAEKSGDCKTDYESNDEEAKEEDCDDVKEDGDNKSGDEENKPDKDDDDDIEGGEDAQKDQENQDDEKDDHQSKEAEEEERDHEKEVKNKDDDNIEEKNVESQDSQQDPQKTCHGKKQEEEERKPMEDDGVKSFDDEGEVKKEAFKDSLKAETSVVEENKSENPEQLDCSYNPDDDSIPTGETIIDKHSSKDSNKEDKIRDEEGTSVSNKNEEDEKTDNSKEHLVFEKQVEVGEENTGRGGRLTGDNDDENAQKDKNKPYEDDAKSETEIKDIEEYEPEQLSLGTNDSKKIIKNTTDAKNDDLEDSVGGEETRPVPTDEMAGSEVVTIQETSEISNVDNTLPGLDAKKDEETKDIMETDDNTDGTLDIKDDKSDSGDHTKTGNAETHNIDTEPMVLAEDSPNIAPNFDDASVSAIDIKDSTQKKSNGKSGAVKATKSKKSKEKSGRRKSRKKKSKKSKASNKVKTDRSAQDVDSEQNISKFEAGTESAEQEKDSELIASENASISAASAGIDIPEEEKPRPSTSRRRNRRPSNLPATRRSSRLPCYPDRLEYHRRGEC